MLLSMGHLGTAAIRRSGLSSLTHLARQLSKPWDVWRRKRAQRERHSGGNKILRALPQELHILYEAEDLPYSSPDLEPISGRHAFDVNSVDRTCQLGCFYIVLGNVLAP